MEFEQRLHPYLRNQIFKVMKTLLSIIAFMLVTSMGPATQVVIKGTVTDTAGSPLAGVVVMVKGTNNTAMTGPDGYTPSPPARKQNPCLPSGNETTRNAQGRTIINVVLEPEASCHRYEQGNREGEKAHRVREKYVAMEVVECE